MGNPSAIAPPSSTVPRTTEGWVPLHDIAIPENFYSLRTTSTVDLIIVEGNRITGAGPAFKHLRGQTLDQVLGRLHKRKEFVSLEPAFKPPPEGGDGP